uniref:Uncharacterized protein n=1 Tax=Oryzias latipes TaxID=8090 RepID=A0A3P9HZT0_ORYLA
MFLTAEIICNAELCTPAPTVLPHPPQTSLLSSLISRHIAVAYILSLGYHKFDKKMTGEYYRY